MARRPIVAHGPEFDAFSLVNISVAAVKVKAYLFCFFFPSLCFLKHAPTNVFLLPVRRASVGRFLKEKKKEEEEAEAEEEETSSRSVEVKHSSRSAAFRTRRKETLLSRKNETQRERLGKDVHYFSVSVPKPKLEYL